MSREAYTPNLNAGSAGSAGQNNTTSTFDMTAMNSYDGAGREVSYMCADCEAKVTLKRGEAIRCKECGYRILYKERTTRMIQFEAR